MPRAGIRPVGTAPAGFLLLRLFHGFHKCRLNGDLKYIALMYHWYVAGIPD